MSIVTPGIYQDADPKLWREHRFGLPADRWSALQGQIFWMTGAGTGFGQSLAVGLALAGARLILSGRRQNKLEATLDLVEGFGAPYPDCLICPVDITDPADLREAERSIRSRFGGITGLIGNAGTFLTGLGKWPLMDGAPEDWDRQFDLNVKGQWLTGQSAIRLMRTGEPFKAVYITSEAGWAFTPSAGHYNVSKAALNNLGASFAAECEDRFPHNDIQINVVAPGEARTEMNKGSETSPFTLVSMILALLSHPPGGPNGRFFFKDGRHLSFAYAKPWDRPLF